MIHILKQHSNSLGETKSRFHKTYFLLLFLCFQLIANAQQPLRVLFLGNSYTDVNNLPFLVSKVAASAGDSVFYDNSTFGGYTLSQHFATSASTGKIMQGNWDYVVLQEQSQLPSFPLSQVQSDCFPYAKSLDSLVNLYNACGETMFYMTWGRKNGDASNCAFWPPVCSYSGMDSLLRMRYMQMAADNQAVVSPAGAVWRYIRANYPNIELYSSDESHPSEAGSYATACCFYTALFQKDPLNINYKYNLDANDAADIRTAVKLVVFDSLLTWHIGEYKPIADFNFQIIGKTVTFTNLSQNASSYLWNFGTLATSNLQNPSFSFVDTGYFQIKLTSTHCGKMDTISKTIYIAGSSNVEQNLENIKITISPNPAKNELFLQSEIFQNGNITIFVCDVNGKILIEQKAELSPKQTINLSGISNQVLIVKIMNEEKLLLSRKVVKLK